MNLQVFSNHRSSPTYAYRRTTNSPIEIAKRLLGVLDSTVDVGGADIGLVCAARHILQLGHIAQSLEPALIKDFVQDLQWLKLFPPLQRSNELFLSSGDNTRVGAKKLLQDDECAEWRGYFTKLNPSFVPNVSLSPF